MSKTGGTLQRLEKTAYLGGLVLLGLLGLAAAVLALLSLWSGAVACLSVAVALLAPLQIVQSRRQLRATKTALRQTARSVPTRSSPSAPAQDNREVVALLSRNNRHLVSLGERLEGLGTGSGDGSLDHDRLAAEVAATRAELAGLRAEQESLRSLLDGGLSAVRADLGALTQLAPRGK